MRKLLCASLMGASLALPLPAVAQVQVDVPGVGVRIGEPPVYERERYRDRREDVEVRERRDYNTGECRTRTVQRERPDGTTVTAQDRVCD
ncbi:hypothetical protein GJW-30_1_00439 [Variibacter gotjawalensis]|uniref:Secreted protein n=1 Tax=Variibacter gotjawalensis TaxID=1333996 RepID=A0A0S3PPS1_9BRAD|nr:hypothetical protein [Variibacter gotjawalensis]NIK48226.1 hypothetical protein [Variibacter gotjawalensis]RZS50098.1 hypothetical protein EV661_2549 [Variibacter gotjawalensis]BAT57928.1 hypothetical protein GJW-30_1_00439 [Variibacter gotjawalensis]